ncbi:MAG: hypothetical protein KDI09_14440 [Halioglobus sp.]|nr:hypothetical protein [Halioglobus sp.]
MKRKSDTAKQTGARSSRMYQENDNWFFNTREGTVVGPFRDELEAYTQLEVYIRLVYSDMLPEAAVAEPVRLRAKPAG